MKVEQRDIFLVPFPFSDFSGKKVRPIIIVSNDKFNGSSKDVIVCGITSNFCGGRYEIKIDNSSLDEGNLFEICCVKSENLLKLDKSFLIKKIGRVKKELFLKVLNKINSIIS
jgi:mRNA interferase MazF